MSNSALLPRAAEAMSRDHLRVDELVARLRSASELTSLVAVLEELSETLVAHFAHEENPGGIYEVMGVANPDVRAPLGDLLGEHYGLLADLRSLAIRGREILERTHDNIHEAHQLADRLAAHETKENALAAEAFKA